MKVQVDINKLYTETTVTIHAKEWNEELASLMNKLQGQTAKRLIGMEEEQSILLDPSEIDYVYSEQRKVFAMLKTGRVELRMKLYEVEEILAGDFIRFSKSVIGNMSMIVGGYFGAASLIFDNDKWSPLKQTVIHFVLSVIVFFPLAIGVGWVQAEPLPLLIGLGIFIVTYTIFWFVIRAILMMQAASLNSSVKRK